MSSHARQIARRDYCRVLLTETLPYETPIIFSNEGLYDLATAASASPKLGAQPSDPIEKALVEALLFGEHHAKSSGFTVPHMYKVTKNSREVRRLALLHPRAQWKIKEFYQKYENVLLYHCSRSDASLRAPEKIAGTYYRRNSWENINQFKGEGIALSTVDEIAKHSPSFFAYRGHDRLHKFFDSRDYFELEKRYEVLGTLDVAKCFDSIYTHSLSWAVKDKEFTKEHVKVKATFAQDFDGLMQSANHNETNGIVIGPEVSRIFAEMIFQEVDARAIERLRNLGLLFDREYSLRRYVDDVFIFADTEANAQKIYKAYADELVAFNLHVNSAKTTMSRRPFATQRSRLIHAASNAINGFVDLFLQPANDNSTFIPKKIHSTGRLARSFIATVKMLCSDSGVGYDELSSFLIAVLTERIKKLVMPKDEEFDEEEASRYRDAILVLLDVMFFLYGVAPSVPSSYKLSTSLILLIQFVQKHLSEHEAMILQRAYDLVETCLRKEGRRELRDEAGYLPLETINLVLAAKELGAVHMLPEPLLLALFGPADRYCYFKIIASLFYIGSSDHYPALKAAAVKGAIGLLRDMTDVLVNSEKAYLLLDMLSCPAIESKLKAMWVSAFFTRTKLPAPTATQIASYLAVASPWQVKWDEIDLLNSLEKKELKQVY